MALRCEDGAYIPSFYSFFSTQNKIGSEDFIDLMGGDANWWTSAFAVKAAIIRQDLTEGH